MFVPVLSACLFLLAVCSEMRTISSGKQDYFFSFFSIKKLIAPMSETCSTHGDIFINLAIFSPRLTGLDDFQNRRSNLAQRKTNLL